MDLQKREEKSDAASQTLNIIADGWARASNPYPHPNPYSHTHKHTQKEFKTLVLPIFNSITSGDSPRTNGPTEQRTDGPMDQWTNGQSLS